MELAAEADLAVSEPESVVSPQAAEDRAAPERGPRGATAAQGEAGQEPPSQGAVCREQTQQFSEKPLQNLILHFFPIPVHIRRERVEALGGAEKRRAGEDARAGQVHEDVRDGHTETKVRK